jgi:hypothetical protein
LYSRGPGSNFGSETCYCDRRFKDGPLLI